MKITITLLIALSLTGCGHLRGIAEQVVGSGVIKNEKRTVSPFTAIDLSGALDIEVVCQKEPSLELEGDDNLLPLVKTEVRGNTLYLKPEKNFSAKKSVRVKITVQNLEQISSSGAGSFRVTDVKNEKMSVNSSGASSIELSGRTSALDLELSGASKVNAEELKAARVKISMSGAGKAQVYASELLDANVSGAGAVTYSGYPKTINKKVSGVGSISRKDSSI